MMTIYTTSSPLAKLIPDGVDVSGPFGFKIFVLLGPDKSPFQVFDVPLVSNILITDQMKLSTLHCNYFILKHT